MSKIKKEPPQHKDLLGQEITLNSKLGVARKNQMYVCSVKKLNSKLIHVIPVADNSNGFLVYGCQTVVLQSEDVLAYMLKGKV
jgi:hypothetical protein